MILIYAHITTERLKFTLDFIFIDVLKTSYQLINDLDLFTNSKGAKINYSSLNIENSIQIIPSYLLFEYNINEQYHVEFDSNKDIFSDIFYLISRYEEYLPSEKDHHNRFKASNSSIKNLEIPIINVWIEQLKFDLLSNWDFIPFGNSNYQCIATYDIDQIYSYKGKGILRTIGGLTNDFIHLQFRNIQKRIQTLFFNQKDPYDEFDYFIENNQNNLFFFLVAENKTEFDKNIPLKSSYYKSIISKLEVANQIGIHPSYFTNKKPELFKKELSILETLCTKKITQSRQHFLKVEFPTTYKNLILNGIEQDYSLGYAENIGFRSGTCTPHYFFDLEQNIATSLKLFPLNIMDTTLVEYLKLNPKQALNKTKLLVDIVKKYKGTLTILWHNSTFENSKNNAEWKKVHQQLMEYAKK